MPNGDDFNDEFAGSLGGSTATSNLISSITLSDSSKATQYNFYEVSPPTISGYVRFDSTDDHQNNSAHPPLVGATVELRDSSGNVLQTTSTDINGYYEFDCVTAGSYQVYQIVPSGYSYEDEFAGSVGGNTSTASLISSIVVAAGTNAKQYNFYDVQPVSLAGVVYLDANANHANSTTDPVVPGVTVQLLNSQGAVIGTTTTNAQGAYSFAGLLPGTYGINEIQSANYALEDSLPGSAGGTDESATLIDSVMLNSGMAGTNYNFWLEQAAALSGTVFQDGPPISVSGNQLVNVPSVRTGILAPGDPLLDGVILELHNGVTGAPILGSQALAGYYNASQPITTATDQNGNYVFKGLLPGNYAVYIDSPSGYITGIDTAGSTGGIVLDAYSTVSQQILAQLTNPPLTDAIIGINLPAGAQSVQNNFSVDLVQEAPQSTFVAVVPPTPQVQEAPHSIFVPTTPAATPSPLQPLVINPTAAFVAYQPPTTPPLAAPPTIYSSSSLNFTWHLSVVDAGQPRGMNAEDESVAMLISATPEQLAEIADKTDGGEWVLAGGNSRSTASRGPPPGVWRSRRHSDQRRFRRRWDFRRGRVHRRPLVCGSQRQRRVGQGRPVRQARPPWRQACDRRLGRRRQDRHRHLRPRLARRPASAAREPGLPDPHNPNTDTKKNVPPGPSEAVPEKRTMKVSGEAKSRADVIDHVFLYGTPQDVPVAGDWNGEGTSTIAVFRNGTWRFDSNGDGKVNNSDESIKFGQAGDKPVVGDWNGDGVSDIGVYRNGTWYLDSNGNHQLDSEDEVVQLGGADDSPAAGDWDGDGRHEPAVFHEAPAVVAEKIDFGAITE